MRVEIKRLTETAVLPVRGSAQAAGYDLCADLTEPLVLAAGTGAKVPTGLSVALPDGYFGGVYARSGLATKRGLRPANCTGIIDSDYRGPLLVPLFNDSGSEQTIQPGERIAQLIIQPYLAVEFDEVTELDATARGEGGFGSTGA